MALVFHLCVGSRRSLNCICNLRFCEVHSVLDEFAARRSSLSNLSSGLDAARGPFLSKITECATSLASPASAILHELASSETGTGHTRLAQSRNPVGATRSVLERARFRHGIVCLFICLIHDPG